MIGRAAFGALLAVFVVVGCLRPALPELLRQNWEGAVLGLAVAAFGLQVLRARALRDAPRFEALLLALLPLALAALYLQPQRVASDGIFYFAPLRSVVVDFDLDFENEYRVLGAETGYFQRTETGRLPNNYSIGPALLWFPSYLAAHVLGLAGLYRATGFGYPYFTAIATTTALVGFAGVILLFRLLRAYFDSGVAFAASLLVWLATFHVWYMVFEPSMSHAIAMASVSAFLLATHRGIAGEKSFLAAGALGGLVVLVRWQNLLFLPVALVASAAARGRPKWRETLVGSLGFLLVVAPQLLYWRALYGSFFLIPQGGNYIDWASPRLEEVLFSSRHGLLSWAPVLWVALAGVPRFVRRAPAFGGGLVLSALAALYVNASVLDWWGGASFGARRFDGVLPLFGLGLAAAAEWLVPRFQKHPLAALGALLSPAVLWNVALMGVYFGGAIPPDGPASFQRAAADGIELFYRKTGYPFSWPGAMADLIAHDRPLSSYDLAGSGSLANNVDIRMGETDALYLGRGWSLPHRDRDGTWREAGPAGGEVFVALVEPAPYRLRLEIRPGDRVEVRLNGTSLGAGLAGSEGEAMVSLPPSLVRSGVNALVLASAAGGRLGIYRVTLTRPGE